MSNFATIVMVVRTDGDHNLDDYDTLERVTLEAAGIPSQPTDESMFLHVERGVSVEAVRLGADPVSWLDDDDAIDD